MINVFVRSSWSLSDHHGLWQVCLPDRHCVGRISKSLSDYHKSDHHCLCEIIIVSVRSSCVCRITIVSVRSSQSVSGHQITVSGHQITTFPMSIGSVRLCETMVVSMTIDKSDCQIIIISMTIEGCIPYSHRPDITVLVDWG